MGLFGKGIYYENDICFENYRELQEAMNCFYKALELEELRCIENKKCLWSRNKGALEYYGESLEIDLDDAEAWFERGLALKNSGMLQEALKSFDKALEIDPNDAEVWYNKGDTLVDIYFLKESIMANGY